MTITSLPPAPSRADPTNFATKADALLGALDTFVSEVNADVLNVNTKSANVDTKNTNVNAKAIQTAADAVQTALDAASALASKNAAELALDTFDDKYLGAKSSDPTLDNDGNALQNGAIYINTTSGLLRGYTTSGGWVQGISAVAGVDSVNGLTGAITLKTLNGSNLTGTGDIIIATDQVIKPLNVSPSNGQVDILEQPVLTSGTFYSLYGTPLNQSRFQISASSTFATILHDSGAITGSLTYTVPMGILQEGVLTYYWRVQHSTVVNAVSYWSEYSTGTSFITKQFFVDLNEVADGLAVLTTIQATYSSSTTYAINAVVIVRSSDRAFIEYKSLQNSNLNNPPASSPSFWEVQYNTNVATSGYLGEVLASQLAVDRGGWLSTTSYILGDMVVIKTGAGFTQGDLTSYVSLTSNSNKPPASNPSDWQQRTALPTGSSLVDALGIWNITPSVKINNDSGWLKFVHNGEVKYIAKKPFLHTVSWNDIAKADCVYGNRTIRIGSKLYRVSLLSGAEADPTTWVSTSTATDNKGAGSEWNTLVYRVHTDVPTDGATTFHGGKQVGSNWMNFTNAQMVMTSADGNGSLTWCKETQASSITTRVLRGYGSLSGFGASDSSTATSFYGFRPCLTLISDLSGYYESEATGAGPSVASLQYDPVTDTGFYGETLSSALYTGSALSTAIGLTAGTLQFDTDPWLKFYWHGQVLFISKKPYRHTVSWDNISTANSVYGVNLGSTGRTRLTKNGDMYDVKLMKGATADPAAASSPGRQWDELMYRVHAEIPTGQIGSNWASYTNTDTQITGNGGYCWMQEVYAPSSTNRVRRGFDSLSYFDATVSSAAGSSFGFRPCLALV